MQGAGLLAQFLYDELRGSGGSCGVQDKALGMVTYFSDKLNDEPEPGVSQDAVTSVVWVTALNKKTSVNSQPID